MISIGGNVKNMNILIFLVVLLDPRTKFQFVQWGLNKFYEKEEAEFLCTRVKDALYAILDVYVRSIRNGQQAEKSTQPSVDMEIDEFDAPEISFVM